MAPSTAFRKDCADCGRSFASPDRKARFCPKCEPRVKEREAKAKKAQAKKTPPPPPPPAPMPPHEAAAALTPELKTRILEAYESRRGQAGISLRALKREIARNLGVGRDLVVQVVQESPVQRTLSPDQEAEIVKRYQTYVERMERPAAGRRKAIAREMRIPYRLVVMAVRNWKQRAQRPMKDFTREERFRVEKAFSRKIREEKPLAKVFAEILEETGLDRWQVIRYLDTIHDGESRLKKFPEVTAGQKEAILAGYADYLGGSSPPGPFLHTLLAEKSGATHQQVHKALLAYRLELLREIKSRSA
jgi:hypothetical protein